jgi:hypothetical protein
MASPLEPRLLPVRELQRERVRSNELLPQRDLILFQRAYGTKLYTPIPLVQSYNMQYTLQTARKFHLDRIQTKQG